jgi:hypothetical protein
MKYKDMSDAGAIHGWRAESDGKHVILVLTSDVKMFRTSLVMVQLRSDQFKLGDLFDLTCVSRLFFHFQVPA